MSSTNRGSLREDSDYYATPHWAIKEFLESFTADSKELIGDDLSSHDLIVLDPCAGGDAERPMSYPTVIRAFESWDTQILTTLDIRDDSPASLKADYLKFDVGSLTMTPDIIITNPPFVLAMPIIRKALRDVRDGGVVVMLLRLNFFGGTKEKRVFFDEVGLPVAAYTHRRRMSFVNGTTDSIEYMHAVWQRGNRPTWTKLKII